MCLLKAHPQNLVCAVPFPISSGAAGGFSLSQPGRDPCFTFAALMGGQPCKERHPASPQHPGRLLHIPLPGAPSLPCQGTVVMWHQGSALGVHLVHTELAPSKARCEEHAEGVDEAALKKASATEPEIRHKASAQAAGAEQAEVKERDWAVAKAQLQIHVALVSSTLYQERLLQSLMSRKGS